MTAVADDKARACFQDIVQEQLSAAGRAILAEFDRQQRRLQIIDPEAEGRHHAKADRTDGRSIQMIGIEGIDEGARARPIPVAKAPERAEGHFAVHTVDEKSAVEMLEEDRPEKSSGNTPTVTSTDELFINHDGDKNLMPSDSQSAGFLQRFIAVETESPAKESSYYFSTADRSDSSPGGRKEAPSQCVLTNERHVSAWIIDPRVTWYRTWQNILAIVVVFSNFYTPVRYAFQDQSSWAAGMDYCIDVLFALDICLTFNVARDTKHGLERDRWSLCKLYCLSSYFWIDLISVLPFSEAGEAMGASAQLAEVLNLLRLLRANRILLLFRELQKNAHFNLMGVVMAKFVLFILLCTHTSGCVFYALASYQNFDESTWVFRADPELPSRPWYTVYLHLLYWAVGTFKAGPAHGDIFPTNGSEMLLSCCSMMVNICLQTYLLSSMAALLTTADVRIYAMRNRLKQLAEFSLRYNLGSKLSGDIGAYIRFKFSIDQDLDNNVIEGLPEILRQRISHALYDTLLADLSIFNGCRAIFLKQLHSALDSSLHMAGHDLAHVDDPSTELQILAEGSVAVCFEDVCIEVRLDGECLTAVPFICGVAQPFLLRTKKLCRILSLRRPSWDSACQGHPEDAAQVMASLMEECRGRRDTFALGTRGAKAYDVLLDIIKSHNIDERESAIGSLCFAAASGDVEKMKRIMRGHTADCADYDKRSPLHIAASKGQLNAIDLLIRGEANINLLDNFGRTPLLEAVRSRQDSAAKLLFESKASLGFSIPPSSEADQGNDDKSGKRWQAMSSRGGEQASELCEAASDPQQLWYLDALIRYGAQVNCGDYDARTAIHVASATGNKSAVELLLSCKDIDANVVDRFGRTPLMEAVRHGHEPSARLLRAYGASHGFCEDGQTGDSNAVHAGQELCQAAFANQTVYLHGLITYCGISVDAADYDLRTALMLACAEGNTDAAVALVQLGADMNRKDRWGHSALTEARDHGHIQLRKLLEQLQATSKTKK